MASVTGGTADFSTAQAERPAPTSRVLVLQSHRNPLPHSWLRACLQSVQRWAAAVGADYRFEDDALFARLTDAERRQCAGQRVVATDLARLRACREALAAGYAQVVWCDADTLVLHPEALRMPASGCAFGRELWLQRDPADRRTRLYRKIHNACMVFSQHDPVLPFYEFAATRMVMAHRGDAMVAQFIGPKLLSHLHNVVQFDVLEQAQVLSPVLARALLNNDGAVLQRYRNSWNAPPAALNLCASEVERGALEAGDLRRVIDLLSRAGADAFGGG